MKLNNNGVIKAWKAGKNARNGRRSLTTDGVSLYSYQLKIGHRLANGVTVMGNYTASGKYKSQTTSCHIGLTRRNGVSQVWHPLVFEATTFTKDSHLEVPF
jgi:hypothetical protein